MIKVNCLILIFGTPLLWSGGISKRQLSSPPVREEAGNLYSRGGQLNIEFPLATSFTASDEARGGQYSSEYQTHLGWKLQAWLPVGMGRVWVASSSPLLLDLDWENLNKASLEGLTSEAHLQSNFRMQMHWEWIEAHYEWPFGVLNLGGGVQWHQLHWEESYKEQTSFVYETEEGTLPSVGVREKLPSTTTRWNFTHSQWKPLVFVHLLNIGLEYTFPSESEEIEKSANGVYTSLWSLPQKISLIFKYDTWNSRMSYYFDEGKLTVKEGQQTISTLRYQPLLGWNFSNNLRGLQLNVGFLLLRTYEALPGLQPKFIPLQLFPERFAVLPQLKGGYVWGHPLSWGLFLQAFPAPSLQMEVRGDF